MFTGIWQLNDSDSQKFSKWNEREAVMSTYTRCMRVDRWRNGDIKRNGNIKADWLKCAYLSLPQTQVLTIPFKSVYSQKNLKKSHKNHKNIHHTGHLTMF